jgi:hypothetical protein
MFSRYVVAYPRARRSNGKRRLDPRFHLTKHRHSRGHCRVRPRPDNESFAERSPAIVSREPFAGGACMFDRLIAQTFEVEFRSHAKAILAGDFPEVADQLEEVLLASTIPIEEIIGSGGGETKGTQRLRNALKQRGWRKHKFVVQKVIDEIERRCPTALARRPTSSIR